MIARQAEPGGPNRVYRTLNMIPYRHIAIEGPVGVGKTALAQNGRTLSVRLCADPAQQSFLTRFLPEHEPPRTGHSCIACVSAPAPRASWCAEEPAPVSVIFCFDKDALFARLTLDADELALYESLRPALLPANCPSLIWWCICKRHRNAGRRIAARGELAFPDGYLKRIDAAYSEFFMQYEAAPVVMVNTNDWILLISRKTSSYCCAASARPRVNAAILMSLSDPRPPLAHPANDPSRHTASGRQTRPTRRRCPMKEAHLMKITVQTLMKLAQEGQKSPCLTCYDASFAATLDEAGVETLLVGDSLGMVMQRRGSTLPVSLEKWPITSAAWRAARNA